MSDEVYEKIVAHIKEEISDVEAYSALAGDCTGYTHAVICGIIKDEESHARYLASALKESGRQMPADLWTQYSEMENTFRNASNR